MADGKRGRSLKYWLVPEGIRDANRSLRDAIRRRRIVSANRDVLAPNASLRGLHAGRRCFVIGNGPSLAAHDLAPLAGEVTFAASGFWKHPIVERWQPTYYCFADPLFFDGSESSARFFEGLRSRITTSTFLVPLAARGRFAGEAALLPPAQVRYVAFSGRLRDGLRERPDLTHTVPGVINVVLMAILAAMYAGCSPIYLIGLDHDWLAHRGADRHFYGGRTLENHSQADGSLSASTYQSLMESQLELWRSYGVIRDAAERYGARVLNASDGGFLDVFERASYAEVLRGAT